MLRNTGPIEGDVPSQVGTCEAAIALRERGFNPSTPTPLATSLNWQTAVKQLHEEGEAWERSSWQQ